MIRRRRREGSRRELESDPGFAAVPNSSGWVLLHGFAGAPAAWDAVRAALPPSSRVFCPALLGHAAETAVAEDFCGEVDRLALAIEAAGLVGAHLCGYSLGARLALGLLVRHRRLFARATLIGVHPGLPEDSPERAARADNDEHWARLAEREGAAQFAAQWAAQPLFASQRELPADVRAAQEQIRRAHDGNALAVAMRTLSLARMPDWRPRLARLDLPVQLIVGAHDTKFIELAQQMATLLPQASVSLVPGVGHNVLLERPSAIIAALLA